MNFNVAVAACVLALSSSIGAADTLTVCSGGGCDYSDIQQAVNAASAGDVISIAAGSYFPPAQIDTLGKAIKLRGATNPDTGVATTFINGQTLRRLFICQNNESASTRFENLIIELGNATLGGGMFIQAGCHPTLVNCAFVTNWAGAAGGAVYCAILTSPTFIDCAFVNNAAYELGGGAVYTTATTGYPSAPRFFGCTFVNNEAILGYGGGMLVSASHPELIDCAFEWNLAGVSGGGLATGDGGETTLEASMVCNNMPNQIYGAWDDDGDNCVNEETCDADDDGTSDCLDECPDDPDKTEPGQCGCGTPDTDSDGDGTADCDDNCPEDPKKTEPGECGCGVSDGDSDGDGTVDCDDLCPFWPGDCSEDGMTIYVEPGEAIDVAVNAVPAGGMVEIEAGVYYLEEIINPRGKAMTIRGAVDGEGSPATIIDRESNGRIAKCVSGEGTDTSFVNIVFTGGLAMGTGVGGGLQCINASPTVSNCVFIANTAVFGGGMSVETGSPVVLDCSFIENASTGDGGGGGMYAYLSSSPTLVNCVFENNTAVDDAGGLLNRTDTTTTLIDCTFEGNEASDVGGAIRNSSSTPTLTGCVLRGNHAGGGEGGGMWNSSSLPVLTNTTVCGNTPDQIYGDWTDAGGNVVDGDSDGDGTLDCDDLCPFWPGDCSEDGMTIYVEPGEAIDVAVNAVPAGGMVEIEAGVYYLEEIINPRGKAMTIRGAVDGEGSPATIIDRESNGRIAKCVSGEGTDTSFVNIVFTGGLAMGTGVGGGLQCINASPTVSNCVFIANTAVFGGGMSVETGSPVVLDCSFIENASTGDGGGGGMYAYLSSSPTLVNCVFENNTAVDDAGGLLNRTDTTTTLIDCTFEGNEASDVGGAICNSLSTPTLTGCVLRGNNAGGGEGGGMWNSNSLPVLTNTTVCGNTPDQIYGDWTDAGGNVVDEACDETPACPLDYNTDGEVNGVDFGLFLAEWGACEGCVGDLNKDGVVNGIDLGLFLVEWGPCP